MWPDEKTKELIKIINSLSSEDMSENLEIEISNQIQIIYDRGFEDGVNVGEGN